MTTLTQSRDVRFVPKAEVSLGPAVMHMSPVAV
jgi:hypothetical protein